MTRFTPLWLQAGSYAASVDRRLIGALYPDARSSGCALSAVGAMDLQVAAGSVAVPLAGGVGSVLCVSDDYEVVTLAAAPASGVNRYDLIVCQAHGADIDAGADEFRFLAVKGADGGGVPAAPANAAALGYVLVVGGSAAVAPANITDTRPGALAVPKVSPELFGVMVGSWVGPAGQTDTNTSAGGKLINQTVTVDPGTYLVTGGAQGTPTTAVPAWVNSVIKAAPSGGGAQYWYNFSVNRPPVNGVLAGGRGFGIVIPTRQAVTFTIEGAAAGDAGGLRFAANSCTLVVVRIA